MDCADARAHVDSCAECAAWRDAEEEARGALRALPYYPAPAALRAAIHDRLPLRRAPIVRVLPALAAAAVFIVAVAGVLFWQHRTTGPDAVDQIVATHVRSLMLPGHLTDVTSSDQHTVKPWFTGRIDFSPPVPDFASQGFPLLGGRLEYLAGRPVAALVYGRRLHRINVFVAPAGRSAGGLIEDARRGFTVLRWTSGGFDYVAVSDVSAADLRDLARLIGTS